MTPRNMLEVQPHEAVVSSATSPDCVRTCLARVLASRHFAESEKLRNFLQFVVETALAGGYSRHKETVLAVEAFGRDTSFDGNSDSVVRNTARRLRANLEAYYQDEGRHDPLRIELPKGGYTPVFHEVEIRP